ncbi:MAG: hypothetical protein OXC29_23240, partial [Rhodococcus sp.]|nr:hypothetical protein [Rhodococcus sp. (in: high G+C Gram-positive bacteria)]
CDEATGEHDAPSAPCFDLPDDAQSSSDVLTKFTERRKKRLPDVVQNAEYLQPDLDTASLSEVIEMCRREFEAATATTGLSETMNADSGMSGVAIKWANASALQMSFSIQNQLRQSLAAHYGEGSLVWLHPTAALDRTGVLTDNDDAESMAPPIPADDEQAQ